jgi:hypothetical protein
MTYSWPKFCTVLVHEYGHLTGHPHTVDGADVMSPIYRAPLPACTTADPSEPPVAPAPVPTTTTTPDEAFLDTPRGRAGKRLKLNAAKRGSAKARSRTKARMASRRLIQFSDADAEPLPWAPFERDL